VACELLLFRALPTLAPPAKTGLLPAGHCVHEFGCARLACRLGEA
jgi:hypothetical protein